MQQVNKGILLFKLLFIVCVTFSFAQEKELSKADKKFESYAFIDAQKIYLRLAKEGYESAELFQKLGDSYYFNGKYEDSAKWFKKLVEKYPETVTPEYLFRYAQSLKGIKQYNESDKIMAEFRKLKGGDSRAELFAEEPDYLEEISYSDSEYEVENLRKTNSRLSDFGPMLYENKLIFSSSRDTGTTKRYIHTWNNEPFLDFYQAPIDAETGELGAVEKFGGNLNSRYHESSPTFTTDGNTMYFTRNNFSQGVKRTDKNGTIRLKIFKSVKKGDSWGTPVELPFNADDYSVSHPALSPDNKKLYFASDMPGTNGFSDIWVVDILGDNEYSTPENLGPIVNTEGRENFPYMSKKGNLYFSSDGRPGLGGLDIYVVTTKKNGDIAYVINLGEPINSPQDDFAFIVDEYTNTGYFSTNRYFGMGSDDIFRFTRIPKEIPVCESLITGTVRDKETNLPIPTATVSILDLEGNLLQKTEVNENGEYTLNPICDEEILIRADEPEYYSAEELVTAPSNGDSMVVDLYLEPRITKINEGDDLAKLLDLKPIYFDFDRFNIRPDAAEELTKVLAVMESNPTLVVEIRSHTDSRGNDAYNLSLSDKRARSTADWIVSRGIEPSRISGKGFGETQLINDCGNGSDCSEEQHQLNRRSEFIVISF
ncbi:OmpA family protein [Leeuwenhoekiella marinoflava]|uniref:Outer membrane protein OmpA-like peptidoglycan-associated protein n=2 Tax=Leeuwenhoekiella marinoflava TaxID=988 RepID=A0A4Q0PNJ6_9FLAO|nr:OmpA family protein [Leeuwenhoekiella marinoflava]RXG32077.1 outer membrane protein OmpA-like peptidoglycan-associated protein [Leeuwenhoekiella marinoflava]SHE97202.1 Outer membrane protein OmpA [Leeuwenhoekiella marinoflava DSM 3653]